MGFCPKSGPIAMPSGGGGLRRLRASTRFLCSAATWCMKNVITWFSFGLDFLRSLASLGEFMGHLNVSLCKMYFLMLFTYVSSSSFAFLLFFLSAFFFFFFCPVAKLLSKMITMYLWDRSPNGSSGERNKKIKKLNKGRMRHLKRNLNFIHRSL